MASHYSTNEEIIEKLKHQNYFSKVHTLPSRYFSGKSHERMLEY